MDAMVKKTQEWLNATYGNDSRFVVINPVDGNTGRKTIYALIRALQIELKIADTADNFGKTTKEEFDDLYPDGVLQQSASDERENNIYAIIQGALWCKGYGTGASVITKHFYSGTGDAIKELKEDAGYINPNSTVTLNLMMELLSMDQFVTLSSGSSSIRSIQQWLNREYEDYIGLIPCDGIYGRAMNKALIQVLQAIEGLTPSQATGNFGSATKANCPLLPDRAGKLTSQQKEEAIYLLKCALRCNGYTVFFLTGSWDEDLVENLRKFQKDYALTQSGEADINTWMSLLLSKGNPDRSALACDCATILTATKAQSLYNAGYRYVGRYLTGTVTVNGQSVSKALTVNELNTIFAAGLHVFAIYQSGTPSVGHFTFDRGQIDARNALEAAQNLGIPTHEIIYFAVDYDMMSNQVYSNVIPYFRGIRQTLNKNQNRYRVGIYGARNVCTQVCNAQLACSSFVADMSTGYSGNMGFPIPDNWAFDQFHEIKLFPSVDGNFDLDKDAYSGRYAGFQSLDDSAGTQEPMIPTDEILKNRYKYLLSMLNLNHYGEISWDTDYTFELGPLEVTYRGGTTLNLELDNDPDIDKYVSIDVENGEFDETKFDFIYQQYNSLEQSLQLSIDNKGNLALAQELTMEIYNGVLVCGTRVNLNGDFIVHYRIEETLWSDDNGNDYQIFISVYFKLSADNYPNIDFSELQGEVDALTVALMVTLILLLLVLIMYKNFPASAAIFAEIVFALRLAV